MEYESSNSWTFDFKRMVCWHTPSKRKIYLVLRESPAGIEYSDPEIEGIWHLLRTDANNVNRAHEQYLVERNLLGYE